MSNVHHRGSKLISQFYDFISKLCDLWLSFKPLESIQKMVYSTVLEIGPLPKDLLEDSALLNITFMIPKLRGQEDVTIVILPHQESLSSLYLSTPLYMEVPQHLFQNIKKAFLVF